MKESSALFSVHLRDPRGSNLFSCLRRSLVAKFLWAQPKGTARRAPYGYRADTQVRPYVSGGKCLFQRKIHPGPPLAKEGD
jgi:hypothetical protein